MTLIIAWWAWPALITVAAFAVTNWWPDTSTGISAAAGGFIRLFALTLLLGVMWTGILTWRLLIS